MTAQIQLIVVPIVVASLDLQWTCRPHTCGYHLGSSGKFCWPGTLHPRGALREQAVDHPQMPCKVARTFMCSPTMPSKVAGESMLTWREETGRLRSTTRLNVGQYSGQRQNGLEMQPDRSSMGNCWLTGHGEACCHPNLPWSAYHHGD